MAKPPETGVGQSKFNISARWKKARTEERLIASALLDNLHEAGSQLLDRRDVVGENTHITRFSGDVDLDAMSPKVVSSPILVPIYLCIFPPSPMRRLFHPIRCFYINPTSSRKQNAGSRRGCESRNIHIRSLVNSLPHTHHTQISN